jgi:hypothetical protein
VGHYVKVASTANQVDLPDGKSHDANAVVLLTDDQFAQLSSTAISSGTLIDLGVDAEGEEVLSFPVTLATIGGAVDVVTNWSPGFAGRVVAVAFVVTTPVTTAGKAATLNLEINTTNLTGGLLALTSANATPLGKVIAGTAITAGNQFEADDTISVEAASVTAFTEGAGVLLVTVAKH